MKLLKSGIPSIYYTETKKGITYYYSFKDKDSKQTKRKKVITKDKHTIQNASMAFSMIEDIKINETIKEIEKQPTTYNKKSPINTITLNQLAKIYYASRESKKKRDLREYFNYLSDEEFETDMIVKKKLYTTTKEEKRYNKHVKDTTLGNTPLDKIDRALIDKYIEEDLSPTLSKKSKFTVMTQLKTIVNNGIAHEIIDLNNPFQNVKFKNPHRQRERVLTTNELKQLLQECRKWNYPQEVEYQKEKNGKTTTVKLPVPPNYNVYTSVYLGILTGARKDMILSIKKKDIDLKNKEITLVNQKASMRHYKIPLNDRACQWLESKLSNYTDNEYIIRPRNKQAKPQAMKDIPETVYKIMDRLFNSHLDKKNNLDRDKVVNFHTLRRSVATNMVKKGTSIYDVMVFLNHSNVEQTMKYLNMNHNNIGREVNKLQTEIFEDF